jgi:hypothetical protein
MSLLATRCQCGAVSVEGPDFENSMTFETFLREFPNVVLTTHIYSSCNHCVNHWGIDLCGCGSEQPVGECDGEYDACRNKTAYQEKGCMTESSVAAMISRGEF